MSFTSCLSSKLGSLTQYAKSKNCMMELRFAEVTLNKPIVGIVVGQGDDWKETEVCSQ